MRLEILRVYRSAHYFFATKRSPFGFVRFGHLVKATLPTRRYSCRVTWAMHWRQQALHWPRERVLSVNSGRKSPKAPAQFSKQNAIKSKQTLSNLKSCLFAIFRNLMLTNYGNDRWKGIARHILRHVLNLWRCHSWWQHMGQTSERSAILQSAHLFNWRVSNDQKLRDRSIVIKLKHSRVLRLWKVQVYICVWIQQHIDIPYLYAIVAHILITPVSLT